MSSIIERQYCTGDLWDLRPNRFMRQASVVYHCGERMWRMPLYKHYTVQIESDVADLRNTGKKRYGQVNLDAMLFFLQ